MHFSLGSLFKLQQENHVFKNKFYDSRFGFRKTKAVLKIVRMTILDAKLKIFVEAVWVMHEGNICFTIFS